MTLEIEKLTGDLDQMARKAAARQKERRSFVDELLETLARYAADWEAITQALATAAARADPKHYRAARPFTHNHPLNAGIDPPAPPPQATLIAADGSQIMPDRHAAHLYYLINVGGIVYFHGDGRTPIQFTLPELHYPQNDAEEADFLLGSGQVSVRRDLREIGALADVAWEYRGGAAPLLAVLDQRLLYWPIGGPDAAPNEDIKAWLNAMRKARDAGALLAGYIDRPMTGYVVTLLQALGGLTKPGFDWTALGKRAATGGLADAALYGRILQPGQRSPVFVNISPPNARFAEFDRDHEVCFFYLNPGPAQGTVARVDIPRWAAADDTAVGHVHALLVDQCHILGGYPYVLARADELAVIGHQDHQELDLLIDLHMQKQGAPGGLTAKQAGKNLARSGKTRFKGP